MTREFNFTCPLANGVHARPASALEEVAAAFSAEILLINSRTGRTANAKSVLSIVGADIRHQDPCKFLITGADAAEAVTALTRFIQEELPRCDEAAPAEQPG
ncbi:MAG TPA: HPr family phosphocarrier protein, partial [Clostridia bacterium]|nr:HPr family phosphocarrier protein [Clostridia bacterium]